MPLTVLVVDGSADMRRYVGRRLGRTCRVLEAADGLDALAVLEHERVDLVIAAADMPRMDGRTLCRALRAGPTASAVPVLVVSDAAETEAGLPSGCGVLTRPFNAVLLQASLEGLLGRPL